MALPRNLDQEIATSLVLWCQQNTVITAQIPANMMFDYYRTDIPITSNMMLCVYPLDYDETQEVMFHYGNIRIDFIFSTQWVRANKTTQALNIESIIVSQIKQSMNASLIDFMNQYIGGLQNFGLQNKGDYRKLYVTDTRTTSKIEVTFKYKLNWMLYQNWLKSFLCDIESPNTPIYSQIDTIKYEQVIPEPS